MRSISCVTVVVLLLSAFLMSLASPVPAPSPHAEPAPAPASESPFSISEYTVDNEGLWTDTEIPLSDASLEAIRQATPATPEDIAAWNAEAEPGMQVQAVIDEELDDDSQADTDTDTDTDAEAEPETEQATSDPVHDDLEIAHGRHGRMLLIPHSPRLMMRRIVMFLKYLISKLKARSPLARIMLKMKIEPVTTPTPTPHPSPARRSTPALGIPHRARPISIRLIPSRSELQTRRLLARCSMLLRAALQRLHMMRQMMIRERRTKLLRRIRGLRFPGRGVILFRANNITATGPSFSQTTMNRLEIEGEKNGTVTIIAPRVNATLSHSIIVINRGTIILLNRSRNNTLAIAPPPDGHGRRRFRIMSSRAHHIMTANENEPQHAEQPKA